MGNLLKRKDKKIKPDTVLCLNIYPKEKGGLKYESMPITSIDLSADRWKKAEDGKYYYLNIWDKDKNKLVPYYPLPEVMTVSADWVARVLSCPYIKLKRLKSGFMGQLQTWMPAVVLALAIFFLIVAGG